MSKSETHVHRWQALCGPLPGGAVAYTYVAEHCRRRRVSEAEARRTEQYEKDLQEVDRLLRSLTATIKRQRAALQRISPAKWKDQKNLTIENVNVALAKMMQAETENLKVMMELPEVISQLHEELLEMDPFGGTVEERYRRLAVPHKFQSEQAVLAAGVLRAFQTTRRRQLADMIAAPKPMEQRSRPKKTMGNKSV